MNYKLIAIALAVTSMSMSCLAQTTPTNVVEDFISSTVNQPGQEYPKVNSQGYARFHVVTPQAQSVSVSLGLGGKEIGRAHV